jgi:hypothetical protein
MNRSEQIREVLRASDGPLSVADITKAVPGIETNYAICVMYRAGMLARDGKAKSYRYWLNREPIDKRLDPEEKKARRKLRERRRYLERRPNPRSFADYLSERAAGKTARLAALAADRELKRKDKVAKKAAGKLKAKVPKAVQKSSRLSHIVIEPPRPCVTKAPVRQAEPESVAAWMARTGQRVEHLPNGAVSQPLLRIGF